MTNKEAIEKLKGILTEATEYENSVCYVTEEDREPLEMAIKALEQESCEDAISRQAVLEYIEGSWAELGHSSENELVCQDIKEMPSVTPQPKMGHWIYDDEYSNYFDVTYKCSCCKREIIVPYEVRDEVYKEYPYCHCGAKMEVKE